MTATFLNPMGFDILVYKLTELTKDYWHTMFVLYGFAFLSFILSFLSFKLNKKSLGNILITIALFLNPLGYDLVVYWINSITKDYWMTISIMYMLAGFFFALFMYFYNINPILAFKYHSVKTHNHIKRKLKRK
jgi:hypothetical protein